MKQLSLRFRLVLAVSIAALVFLSLGIFISWYRVRADMETILDTQQLIMAQRLAESDIESMLAGGQIFFPRELSGRLEYERMVNKDVLAFAIFNKKRVPLLNDGFYGLMDFSDDDVSRWIRGSPLFNMNKWRMIALNTQDNAYIIAVGRHLDYRNIVSRTLIFSQMIPWLLLYPVLLIIIIMLINYEFRALGHIAAGLRKRPAWDTSPLAAKNIPGEVWPFVDALNGLFARIETMLIRERRFISDASHELRSPLSGLRVQAELALLSEDDPDARRKALDNLIMGIDRTSHLAGQLLYISKLDSMDNPEETGQAAWDTIIQNACIECAPLAEKKSITLKREHAGQPLSSAPPSPFIEGNEFLLTLMLSNVIGNAVHYGREGGTVTVVLDEKNLIIRDNGPGIEETYLGQLGQRFFRVPGTRQAGTGLGLSIVQRIAGLHNIGIQFGNAPGGGFMVTFTFAA